MDIERYNYKILTDKRLIIKYFHGSFSMPDIIEWMDETGQDSLFDPSFSVLNDYRDAESKLKMREINEFVAFLKENKKFLGNRKSAFLTKTPNQTAFTLMLGLFKNELLIDIETFSTLLEATRWLGLLPSDLDGIAKSIYDLKKQLTGSV
jgi:hypothetical protein